MSVQDGLEKFQDANSELSTFYFEVIKFLNGQIRFAILKILLNLLEGYCSIHNILEFDNFQAICGKFRLHYGRYGHQHHKIATNIHFSCDSQPVNCQGSTIYICQGTYQNCQGNFYNDPFFYLSEKKVSVQK